jgi:beta-phosphoglucomutase
MIKAVIFDLDGVLVDTMDLHFKSWVQLGHHLGFSFHESNKNKLRGASRFKSMEIVLEAGQISATPIEKKMYSEMKNNWYHDLLKDIDQSILLPGTIDSLEYLKKNNYKTALASASKNAKIIINKLNMQKYFDVMVDANDVLETKPDPEVFLKAAKLLKTAPKDCVVIEDSPLGIQAAKDGGFLCIGIGNKSGLKGADWFFENTKTINFKEVLENSGHY